MNIQDVKLFLRVDQDEEDALITRMIATATAAAESYLNCELPDPLPTPVESAMLLLIGDLYGNRELQADRAFHQNQTYQRLLDPYRAVDV